MEPIFNCRPPPHLPPPPAIPAACLLASTSWLIVFICSRRSSTPLSWISSVASSFPDKPGRLITLSPMTKQFSDTRSHSFCQASFSYRADKVTAWTCNTVRGLCILRSPIHGEACGLKLKVVLKLRDIYIENVHVAVVALMGDLKIQGIKSQNRRVWNCRDLCRQFLHYRHFCIYNSFFFSCVIWRNAFLVITSM